MKKYLHFDNIYCIKFLYLLQIVLYMLLSINKRGTYKQVIGQPKRRHRK